MNYFDIFYYFCSFVLIFVNSFNIPGLVCLYGGTVCTAEVYDVPILCAIYSKILSVLKFTTNLYCICLSNPQIYT